MRKAAFLDRDGTLNRDIGRLTAPEQLELASASVGPAVRRLNDAGYAVIVVTNQPDLAKGFLTIADLERVHQRLREVLAGYGARIDAIYVCPHHPEKGHPGEIPSLKRECACRKPKPGLLLQAAKERGIDLAASFMIGDKLSDVEAGKAAGVGRTALLGARQAAAGKAAPDVTASDLGGAVHELLGSGRKGSDPESVPIIVVAGGLATRMRPLTERVPKCLMDINGLPLAEHQLLEFRRQGFTEIIFCVAHLADRVQQHFGDGSRLGMRIRYVREPDQLLGTAGSVRLAGSLFEGDAVVFYGDNLTSIDLRRLLSFHRDRDAHATVCLRPARPQASSIVVLGPDSRVQAFLEKPSPERAAPFRDALRYENNGIYVLGHGVIDSIPSGKHDFALQLFPRLVEDNAAFYGYVTEEYFREVGKLEKYDALLRELDGRMPFS